MQLTFPRPFLKSALLELLRGLDCPQLPVDLNHPEASTFNYISLVQSGKFDSLSKLLYKTVNNVFVESPLLSL